MADEATENLVKQEFWKFDEYGNPIFEETTDVIKTVEFEGKNKEQGTFSDEDEYEGDNEDEPLLAADNIATGKKRTFNYLRNLMGINDIRQSASIEDALLLLNKGEKHTKFSCVNRLGSLWVWFSFR